MRTDVLQAAAICYHGNAYLADPERERASEMLLTNSLFKGVFDIAFERPAAKSRNLVVLGNSVSPWLRRLRIEDVQHLRLRISKIPYLDDMSTDDVWGIVSDGAAGTELWEPIWRSRLVRYGAPPSWNVKYFGEKLIRWAIVDPPAMPAALKAMDQAWSELQEVGARTENSEVVDLAGRFLKMQRQASMLTPGFPDFFPLDMSIEPRVLASSAVRTTICLSGKSWLTAYRQGKSDFCAATRNLWAQTMLAFEAVAGAGA